ncbi:Protein asteroid 1 [Terramyces sp. JEL0728]|nr:Protein asteroid 1 [Terramyces sp. JEL0728]
MGIFGLTLHIKQNFPSLGERIHWDCNHSSDGVLIVDGNSFGFQIAREINWLHGPQYHAFTYYIEKYFTYLIRTGKRIIVVFDGALPKYKLSERLSRNQERVDRIHELLKEATASVVDPNAQLMAASILPPFAVPIVIETVKKLGLEYIIAREEADSVIAGLAKKHDAYVLSQDSDFYVYDIPGFIPLDTINFKMNEYLEENLQESSNSLSVVLYTRKKLGLAFGVQPNLLYLVAVLGGSDHFSKDEISEMYKLNPGLGIKNQVKPKQKWPKVIQLVRKFNSLAPRKAKDKILELIKPDWRSKLETAFTLAQLQYDEIEYKEITNTLDIEKKFALGLINPKIFEILNASTFWCTLFLENYNSPTSWDAAQNIRIGIYRKLAVTDITEHYRSSNSMCTRLVALTNSELPVPSIENSMDAVIYSFRELILYLGQCGRNIGNHELCGWIASMLLVKDCLDCNQKVRSKPITPTKESIHQLAQIECILFCLSLLYSLDGTDVQFWELLDGPTFHWCHQHARKGASPKSLLGKVDTQSFKEIYTQVIAGLENFVDIVIEYPDL